VEKYLLWGMVASKLYGKKKVMRGYFTVQNPLPEREKSGSTARRMSGRCYEGVNKRGGERVRSWAVLLL